MTTRLGTSTKLYIVSITLCVLGITAADNTVKPPQYDHGINIPTKRPLNIAHRGSSGVLPAHTAPSYQQSIEDGADVIECDVTISKDLVLLCLHEPILSSSTNIEDYPDFADRKTDHVLVFKGNVTDWYTYDFTLAELKTLRLKQKYSFRDQSYNWQFNITTFDEYIAIVKGANRPIAIYPELKDPALINSLDFMDGRRVEDIFLESLNNHGYSKPTDLCYIQCFDEPSLEYIANKTELLLFFATEYNDEVYGPNLNESKLQGWAEKYYGLIAWKDQVSLNYYTTENGYKNRISEESNLLSEAKAVGLKVHLYTFRNEDQYLAWNFMQDPRLEYEYYMSLGIDGYFTDFPATFKNVLDTVYREDKEIKQCTNGASFYSPVVSVTTLQTVILYVMNYMLMMLYRH